MASKGGGIFETRSNGVELESLLTHEAILIKHCIGPGEAEESFHLFMSNNTLHTQLMKYIYR